MSVDLAVSLSRHDIEQILMADPAVVAIEHVGGGEASWNISVSWQEENLPRFEMFVDNDLNSLFVQLFVMIDNDYALEALNACAEVAIVGLARFGEHLCMRSAFFLEYSTRHALTDTYRTMALAYNRYLTAICKHGHQAEDAHQVSFDSSYSVANDLAALDEQVKRVDADWSTLQALSDDIVMRVRRIVDHDSGQRENLAQLVRWASSNGLVESAQHGTRFFEQLFEELKAIFPEARY